MNYKMFDTNNFKDDKKVMASKAKSMRTRTRVSTSEDSLATFPVFQRDTSSITLRHLMQCGHCCILFLHMMIQLLFLIVS